MSASLKRYIACHHGAILSHIRGVREVDTKTMLKCYYCGDDATTKDHIIPVSYYQNYRNSGRNLTSEYGEENLVDCCGECNSIAGSKVFDDIYKKKDYIQDRLVIKYKKVTNMPSWSTEEINELGKGLRKEIKIQELARRWITNRINHPLIIYDEAKLSRDVLRFLEKEL